MDDGYCEACIAETFNQAWRGIKKTPVFALLMLRQASIKTLDHSHATYSA